MQTAKLYKTITDAVVNQLEDGVPPWVRPWRDGRLQGVGMIPTNLVTGRRYSGSNVLLLWMTAHAYGYSSLQYCTFHQANQIGASVRKGEKCHHVIFTKRTMVEDRDTGEEKAQTVAKAYAVFNVSQLDKVDPKYLVAQQVEPDAEATLADAVGLVRGNGVQVVHGGNEASYDRIADRIRMPYVRQFEDEDAYWQTMAHELTHASGHPSRLDREFGKRFGDQKYAFEELVAELGSSFLCARLGIPAGFRSASYIGNWLKVLKQDSRAIFTASSYAGQASDHLWNTAFPPQEDQEVQTETKKERQEEYSLSM